MAIEYLKGVGKLADAIGVGQSVISNWRARDSVIDPLLCSKIESATDGTVTRQMLRPDDWQTIWPELVTPVEATPLIEGRPIDGAVVRETKVKGTRGKIDTRRVRE